MFTTKSDDPACDTNKRKGFMPLRLTIGLCQGKGAFTGNTSDKEICPFSHKVRAYLYQRVGPRCAALQVGLRVGGTAGFPKPSRNSTRKNEGGQFQSPNYLEDLRGLASSILVIITLYQPHATLSPFFGRGDGKCIR